MEVWEQILANANLLFWTTLGIALLIMVIPLFRKWRDSRLLKAVTTINRGTKSEQDLVLKLVKKGIPASTIFHDLYIVKSNGKIAQLDVVIATTEGIIVIEVKDFSGWIFGNGNNSNWTKILAYGKRKYRFYNPIKQNKNHIESLRKQLNQFKNIPFFSIIVFYGDCELKDIEYVPEGTFLVKPHRVFEVLAKIKNNNEPAPYSNKHDILMVLKQAVKNGENLGLQEKHIEDIKDLVGKHRIYD